MAGAISQIQTNRQLVLFENLIPLYRHSANLLHCRSPLRLERVVHWERIASRWRPAFSSHLIGTEPEDSDYVALSYTELANLIDTLARDQREALSDEMALVLRHYVDMLRRNIVEDDKLVQLAIRLYEKHKEAFEFVGRHQPQPKSLLDDIRKLITFNAMLKEDRHNPAILRFVPVEWTTVPQLNSCPVSGWTKTGRSLLFEVKASEEGRIIVALVLGPSNVEGLRERVYSEAKKRTELFAGLVKPMGLKWSTIFSVELMTASEAGGMGQEEQVEAIEIAWQNFVDRDLPALKKVILEFF